MIHLELCKRPRLGYADKWNMHKPESIQENEKQNILWNFEMQTNHQISIRRPDPVIISKEK